MNRSTVISMLLILLGGGFLIFRASTGRMGQSYARVSQVNAEKALQKQLTDLDDKLAQQTDKQSKDSQAIQASRDQLQQRINGVTGQTWTTRTPVAPKHRGEEDVKFNWPMTIGLWVSAFGMISILSFLFQDNILYKLTEAILIGVSAAYAMVLGFWDGIVGILFVKLTPSMVRETVLPATPLEAEPELMFLVPLILSGMLLMRLSPTGNWIARWPLAFFIGLTAGFRLVGFLEADFVQQIQATILPLVVLEADDTINFGATLKNTLTVVTVFCCLVYFFFSIEHQGVVGGIARLGIGFLMITFGAGFGYTVMGRIALIAERMSVLFDDWLWLIDPTGKRIGLF
jgi:hypothetical protein